MSFLREDDKCSEYVIGKQRNSLAPVIKQGNRRRRLSCLCMPPNRVCYTHVRNRFGAPGCFFNFADFSSFVLLSSTLSSWSLNASSSPANGRVSPPAWFWSIFIRCIHPACAVFTPFDVEIIESFGLPSFFIPNGELGG